VTQLADARVITPPPLSELRRLRARGGIRGVLPLLGPAFVAAVAYVDPGNFATNVAGGAKFGFLLMWAVLAANLMAMLIQYLSAKVGIATDQNLPELCREHFPRPVAVGLWVQAEVIAMATDLAELVGAALALNILFGIPLFVAGLIGGVGAFALLALHSLGYRRFEAAIIALLGVILLVFLYETLTTGPNIRLVASGFIPRLKGTDSLLLAVGMIGATVMPHVIYLHSALTQNRIRPHDDAERHELVRFQRLDVVIAMTIAGVVNLAMLAVIASLFHGVPGADTIEGAHAGLKTAVGGAAALAFALALLASGLSASSVGTYAGQIVMQGFIRRSIPLFVRRAVTMTPALIVLGIGFDPTTSLVISQVVLSFGIPFALIPLVLFTSRRDVMGTLVNHRLTTGAAVLVAFVISALNVFLLAATFLG